MSTMNRPRAALIAVFGVIIAAVALASPASAVTYPPPAAGATVSTQNPAVGGSVEFCGKGFTAGERVTIKVGATSFPSVTADSSGEFCTTLVLGVSLSGPQTIVATGVTSGTKVSASIVVGGTSTGGTGGTSGGGTSGNGDDALANTGAVVISIGALGVLLVVGGSMLVLAGRRRNVKVNA
jgi:hypothetical protein